MFRVYAFDNEGREQEPIALLFKNLDEARHRAAEFEERGLRPRIYRQGTNRNGDLIETLVDVGPSSS